ncbi:hypothetical protein ACWC5I_44645, partial [Kitasatospora sp. NPDC001574]
MSPIRRTVRPAPSSALRTALGPALSSALRTAAGAFLALPVGLAAVALALTGRPGRAAHWQGRLSGGRGWTGGRVWTAPPPDYGRPGADPASGPDEPVPQPRTSRTPEPD